MKYIKLIILLASIYFYSCQKKNESPIPSITVSPSFDQSIYKVGDTIFFKISARSNDGLKHIKITELTKGEETKIWLDSVISSAGYAGNFNYIIKAKSDNKAYSTTFEFIITDEDNDVNQVWRQLFILEGGKKLVNTPNQVIFTANSGGNSGYNLETLANLVSNAAVSDIDILDSPTSGSSSPEKRWTSPAGGKFVLAPTFDFDNATDSLIIRAYNLANKLTVVANFKEGDVIITKLGNAASENMYAAIKIKAIIDSVGTSADRYVLDIKK